MQLLIIRHAIAEERETFTGNDDSLRPLTKEGRKKMADVARGLHHLVPKLDLLAASPLVRAQQTAAIVAERYDDMPIVTAMELDPESALASLVSWLRAQNGDVIAVVGHEPHLGTLVTWLLTGIEKPRMEFGKGGACLLKFSTRPRKGGATMEWLLTPSQLRRIGKP